MYDQFRNDWKNQIKRRQSAVQELERTNKETVCAMFVPPSRKSELMGKVLQVENKLRTTLTWNMKIMEQSGIPLSLTIIPKFKMQ